MPVGRDVKLCPMSMTTTPLASKDGFSGYRRKVGHKGKLKIH